jgi:hypothetical protein
MSTARLRAGIAVCAAAVVLLAAGIPTTTPAAAVAATSDPLAVAQGQLAGCQAWLAQHPTSNTAQATRMKQCVTDEQAIIAALTPTPAPTTPTASPTASPTPTAVPSQTATSLPPSTPPPTTVGPSPTPTPSPTIQPAVACMDNPAACGYPDTTNTGVPAGTTLTTTGSMTLTAPGTYSGLDIRGCVTVAAAGVTLTRSRVSGCTGSYAVRVDSASAGFVMSDSEIVMQGDQKGLVFVGYTAQRLKVTGTGDCFGTGTNSVIQDSYCENGPGNSPKRAPTYGPEPSWCGTGAHWDGVEAGATTRTIIRHNTFRLPCGQTGAVDVSDWNGPIAPSSVVVDNNLLAGGSWTVYGGAPSVSIVLTNNRFSRWYWPGSGSADATEAAEGYCWTAVRSGNVWDETGTATAALNS